MKLLDKIKDLFMDEVTDDDELEFEDEDKEIDEQPKKKEKAELPKVMRETIKKEEKTEISVKPRDLVHEESEPVHKKFNFPVDVDNELPSRNVRNRINEVSERKVSIPISEKAAAMRENVFEKTKTENSRTGNVNILNIEKETSKKVAELYSKKSDDKNIKPKFKASPVISPVYGVLDKNYTKEEVKERPDDNVTMKRPSKKVDFETVRKKAFGNLADDIKENMLCENCELYKEVKKISALKEDDLLYDMTVDGDEAPKENKEITIEKAYDDYEEFGVAYEPKIEKKHVDLEEDVKNSNIVINNNNEHENTDSEKNTFSSISSKIDDEEYSLENAETTPSNRETINDGDVPSRSEKKKETKVDDDFFELIDSMYKERIDE